MLDRPNTYLILTRSQKAYAELYRQFPPEDWDQFEADLLRSPVFKLLYNADGAKVFVLAQGN
jgi:hypothetical protein